MFACGDIVKGPSSLAEAMALSRKTASAVDKFLGGSGDIDETFVTTETPKPLLRQREGFAYQHRVAMRTLPVEKRVGNFDEAELGLSEEAAVEEADRCLRCDLRLTIGQPTFPPERWMTFGAGTVASVPEAEGVFQLLDENKHVIYIKGAINLRQALMEKVTASQRAKFFLYEEAKMFTM